MLNTLVRNWWAVALRGLFAVIFGLVALLLPGITLASLIILFGVYSFADGVMSIAAAFQNRRRWWAFALNGVLGIGAGVVAFLWPGITALALLYLIAAWAIVGGGLQILAAVRLRQEIAGEVLLILSGIASIAFGVVAMIWPGAGALTVVWLIGSYALVSGVLLIVLGFRLRARKEPAATHAVGAPGDAMA